MSHTSGHFCANRRSSAQYTDVLIVGNGPSAICLSYFLSGFRPFYNGADHSNIYLHQKLKALKETDSVVDQDLEYLSEGLEGRSSNPVALLFDALCHPDADLGTDNPSVLHWQKQPENVIKHAVLGRNKPGGAWQQMDGNMQTLSLSKWMELPSLTFQQWLDERNRLETRTDRATIADVRSYYSQYVSQLGLDKNFFDHHVVTSVRKVYHSRNGADSESGEVEPCCDNVTKNHSFLWEVRGYKHTPDETDNGDLENGNVPREEFCFHSPHVVLATGTYDIPNKLGVPGENKTYVHHSLPDFEKVLAKTETSIEADPILVIGAGLSAADAVIMALEQGMQVVHLFRRDPDDSNLIFRKLPAGMYPEYHKVHALMGEKCQDPLYRPYSRHQVVELKDDRKVLLESLDNDVITSIDISFCVILIGSRPDLSFLPQEGRNLGVVPRYAVDSKHNPVDVDLFSYQSNTEPGLFAVGPLVGDNFVRFAMGGSLGVTNYLLRNVFRKSES